jgi:hypothetical protein
MAARSPRSRSHCCGGPEPATSSSWGAATPTCGSDSSPAASIRTNTAARSTCPRTESVYGRRVPVAPKLRADGEHNRRIELWAISQFAGIAVSCDRRSLSDGVLQAEKCRRVWTYVWLQVCSRFYRLVSRRREWATSPIDLWRYSVRRIAVARTLFAGVLVGVRARMVVLNRSAVGLAAALAIVASRTRRGAG